MNSKTKLFAALTALTLAATFALLSNAEARGRGWAIGAGILGAAIVAGAVASAHAEPVYVGGYRSCKRVAQFDHWGNYVGSTKVCRYYY